MALEVKGKVSLDGSGFDRTLASMGSKMSSFGAGAVAAVGAAGAAIVAVGMQAAGQLQDMSDKLNVSVEKLQAWGYSAEANASSLDALGGAFIKTLKAQVEALEGSKATIAAFETLGVSVDDLEQKSPEQIFEQIAGGMKDVGADARQTAALMEVMGKTAADLVPTFKAGLGGGDFNDWSVSLPKNVALVDELGDALVNLKNVLKAFSIDALGTFVDMGKEAAKFLGIIQDTAALPLPKYMQDEKDAKKRVEDAEDAKAKKAAEEAGKVEDARQRKVADLREKLVAAQKAADYASLNTEQKKARLQQEIADAQKVFQNFDLPEEQRLRAQLDALAASDKLKGLEAKKPDDALKTALPSLNQFQAIGGYVGGNPMLDLSRQQLQTQKEIARNTNPNNRRAQEAFF